MNIGYIYKITNKTNNKCYIGQTIQHYTQRWKEHKNASKNKLNKNYNHPLYRAFRKYGINNFNFEVLEECFEDDLNKKEMYWISFYDSFRNGYNLTLGGEGNKIYDLDEKRIIKEYQKLKSMQKVADLFGCSTTPIKAILLKNNISILNNEEVAQNYNHKVKCLDDSKKIIKEFCSIAEAAKWISGAKTRKEYRKTHAAILRAIINEKKYFNYYWVSDFYTDEMKKEKIKKHNSHKYNKSSEKCKTKKCPICGTTILLKSDLCQTCHNKKIGNKALNEKERKHNVTRDILKQEIRTTSFTELGERYGVSDNAIRRWCKTYNLPYKKSDINNYSDKEWKDI